MPQWSNRALIPVVGLLLVATACGDGEKKATRRASATSTSESPTTSTGVTPTTAALVVRPTARLTAQRTTRPAVQGGVVAAPVQTVQPTVRAATTTTRRAATAATTTTRPTDPFAGDPAKARGAVLRADDLSTGFTANGVIEDK